jgi:hypothetical protein
MAKYWKEYWIIIRLKSRGLQLINNWHEWRTEDWYLIGLFRKWHNGSYDYYFALLGFQLRLINFKDRDSK